MILLTGLTMFTKCCSSMNINPTLCQHDRLLEGWLHEGLSVVCKWKLL